MREIKFRCWDKDTHRLYYQSNEHPCFTYGDLCHCSLEDVLHYHKEDFELMQYAGLEDKNGREIYEGDIVKFYNKDGDWFAFGICYYDTEETSFLHTFHEVRKNKIEFEYQRPPKRFWSNKSFSFEVIGNIYENPELLE